MSLRNNYVCVCVGLAVLLIAGAGAAPKSDQVRQATLGYITDGNPDEGIRKMTDYLSRRLSTTRRISSTELASLAGTADCIRFLELAEKGKPDPGTAKWILSSGGRLHLFLETLHPKDKPESCFKIMDQLRRHDPAGADEYFNLILSIAVILDRPSGSPIHGQMGRDRLPPEHDPVVLYDYYKELYASGDAKMNYEKLSPAELVFVVHAPSPISEIKWARENVKGSLSGWGDKYSDIEYDHARLNGSRFSWDHGTYTLCEIEERGGICVDQAYYAVVTARAWGIPAIYFHGSGKSANHAWFGYMKSPGEWDLDVGRYQNSSYTTGYAIDYQAGETMTDHDVEFMRERSTRKKSIVQASIYVSLAEVMEHANPDVSLKYARMAREEERRMLRAWKVEQRVLTQQKAHDELIRMFDKKKDAFRKYPDILVETAKEINAVLLKAGKNEAAARLNRSASKAVDDDRDDITRSFESQRIQQIIDSGDVKKARKEMEQMLDEHKDQGNKIFGLIRQYIKLTKDSGQTGEAVKFLEDYIEDLIEEYSFPPRYKESLLKLLLAAYENDGETKDAAKLKKQIERLQLQQNM